MLKFKVSSIFETSSGIQSRIYGTLCNKPSTLEYCSFLDVSSLMRTISSLRPVRLALGKVTQLKLACKMTVERFLRTPGGRIVIYYF